MDIYKIIDSMEDGGEGQIMELADMFSELNYGRV